MNRAELAALLDGRSVTDVVPPQVGETEAAYAVRATAELMVDLHAHLDAGADPATALLAVRAARPGDPTAASFVALGV